MGALAAVGACVCLAQARKNIANGDVAAVAPLVETAEDVAGLVVRDAVSLSGAPRRFIRLHVTRP